MAHSTLFTLLCFLVLTFSCSTNQNTSKLEVSEGERFNRFLDKEFEKSVARYPTSQTYLGRKTNYGKLNNETEAFQEQEHELTKKSLEALKEFDFESLNKADQLSYKLYEHQLENEIEGNKWRHHRFPLNQMFGYQSTTPAFLINMHRVDSKDDALAYISRLKEIQRVFNERMTFLKKQESQNIFPPDFVFEKVLNDSHNIISGKPFSKKGEDSPLLKDFKKKVSALKLSKEDKTQLVQKARSALLNHVHPAYLALIAYAKELDKKVSTNKGAWSLPEGRDYYNYRLRTITTTDMDAEEIHKVGLQEVRRIHAEMKAIMKRVGFKGSLKDFFTHMKGEKFLYPSNKEGRQAYLKDAKTIIKNMEDALPKIFNTFPKAALEIKPVEAYREKSAGIAFYSRPSLEGDRPGIYYVNLYKMEDNPKYKMEALAYHEAVPGHHMQIAIATELEGLPMFRRVGGYTAYIEGWGLYAELLPKELGFYQDPYSDFGRLSMELWRATRLVVDTGIHAKRWTREKAIKYLNENTSNSKLEIIKGVERYFVMPGQATAYKVGMMKILELRQKAKKALGPKFNLADFHDIVLRDGALPLFTLEQKVDSWIESSI